MRARRGRRELRRKNDTQWNGKFLDTDVRHALAPTHTIGALAVAVIEATFFAALIARGDRPAHQALASVTTRLAAVALASETRSADVEERLAPAATLLVNALLSLRHAARRAERSLTVLLMTTKMRELDHAASARTPHRRLGPLTRAFLSSPTPADSLP
jgi:hypothetical protein